MELALDLIIISLEESNTKIVFLMIIRPETLNIKIYLYIKDKITFR